MRRRLLAATVSAVMVAILLLGIPLAIVGGGLVFDREIRELESRTTELGRFVEGRISRSEMIDTKLLNRYVGGDDKQIAGFVRVTTPAGETITAGEEITGRVEERPVLTQSNAIVIISVSYWDIFVKAAQIVGLIVLAAMVAGGVGIVIAVWQANRLSAPMVYLAASAEMLGSGQVRPMLKPSGVEELDLVAAELARSADRMAGRLAAERQFSADASHQLRTPLTALSMRLEEIMYMSESGDVIYEEARKSLEQVERLVNVVDDLLTQARNASSSTEAVRLSEVFQQQREEWEAVYAKVGRDLEFTATSDLHVLVTPGALSQILATLIENSLKHGAGKTEIVATKGAKNAIQIQIGDEGDGVSDEIAGRIFDRGATSGAGTGLGLSVARDLAASDGGRLELSRRVPAVFTLYLAGIPVTLDPERVVPKGVEVSTRKGFFSGN